MAKINQNIRMHEGETRDVTVIVADLDADPEGETPKNLNNAQSITWSVYERRKASADAIIEKTLDDGISITDGPNGKFLVGLVLVDTEDKEGVYVHKTAVVDAQGRRSVVTTGRLTIKSS